MKIKFLDGSEREFETLRGADMSCANLTGADLTGANLAFANLRDADLTGADLTGANLRDADLTGADLTGANLAFANLRDADLTGADLTGANLTRANLRGADLDFSCWPLWCGSLEVKADRRIACQLLYHALAVMARCGDEEAARLSRIPELLKFANEFHRRGERSPIHAEDEVPK